MFDGMAFDVLEAVLIGVDIALVFTIEVMVDVAQDTNTSDVTIRQGSIIQINPLFIWFSFNDRNLPNQLGGACHQPRLLPGLHHGRGHQPHLAENPTTNSQYPGTPLV